MPDATVSSAAALPSFSGVFSFGDSTLDPGNDLKVLNFLQSFPIGDLPNSAPTADRGYFEGRFSNGYNFADLISNKMLGEPTQPTFPYGVSNLGGISIGAVGRPSGHNLSFAYGGAMIGKDNPAPSLDTQVSIYHNFTPDPNALYVISVGSNDLFSLVPTSGTPVTGAAATAQISALASAVANDVVRLLGQGVRHLVVADAPDLGVTPTYADSANRGLISQYAASFNAQLKADVAAIAMPAGATTQVFDFFGYSDAVVADPAAYHFSNVTQALIAVQPNAPDPSGAGFLFFDQVHPTAQAYAQITSEILNMLQNPGAPPDWTPAASVGAQASASVTPGAVHSFTASLTGGQSYVVDGLGVSSASGTLADPVVRVLDGSGAVVAQADDGGIGLDAHLTFTAPASGDYVIQVLGAGVTGGDFHLQAADSTGANLLTTGKLSVTDATISAGPEDDTLTGLAGTNVIFGGGGNDSITGGTGFDRINGNMGDDTIVGRSTIGDWLRGGQGNDSINAVQSSGHNIINGDLGADTIAGGSGGDTLRGGQGDDVITGGAGANWISGDLGHNTLTGGVGADTFHGGAGVDVVSDFSLAQGDRVQLDPGVTFTATQTGADTLLVFSNGGQMTLRGVQETSLTGGWIFNA
jgi:Ca2+-binding RTX toxin-like protein